MSDETEFKMGWFQDQECTKAIKEIQWSEVSSQLAIARVWVKNLTEDDYAITGFSVSDPRIKVSFSSYWIYPTVPILLTLVFDVPKSETWVDLVKNVLASGDLVIHGYFKVD